LFYAKAFSVVRSILENIGNGRALVDRRSYLDHGKDFRGNYIMGSPSNLNLKALFSVEGVSLNLIFLYFLLLALELAYFRKRH